MSKVRKTARKTLKSESGEPWKKQKNITEESVKYLNEHLLLFACKSC